MNKHANKYVNVHVVCDCMLAMCDSDDKGCEMRAGGEGCQHIYNKGSR